MDSIRIRRQKFTPANLIPLFIAFGAVAVSWCLPLAVLGAGAINYSTNTTINLGSNSVTIYGGSTVSSTVVNAGTLVVTVPIGQVFTVGSALSDITVTGTTTDAIITTTCNSSGYREITVNAENVTAQTLTFTPTGSQCASTARSASNGGTFTFTPAPTTPPVTSSVPAATTTQAIVTATTPGNDLSSQLTVLLQRLAFLQGQAKALAGGNTITLGQIPKEAVPAGGSYKKPILRGTSGPSVSSLQSLLRALGPNIYPEGIVSGYFGKLTTQAVERFQLRYGLAKKGESGFGIVGPKTRATLNSLITP